MYVTIEEVMYIIAEMTDSITCRLRRKISYKSFRFLLYTWFYCWAAALVMGTVLLGLAEVIRLLERAGGRESDPAD